jgi:ABC-2 type transport system permease protein
LTRPLPPLPTPPTTGRLPGTGPLLAAQIGYQLRLLLRTPRAVFAGVLLPVLLLVLRDGGSGGDAQLPALVAGLMGLGVITTAYVTHAAGLVAAREAGVLRRWRASPLPAWCYFTGRIVATVAVAGAGAAVTALVAGTMLGVSLDAVMALRLLLAVSAGALAWSALGTAVTALLPTAEGALPLLTVTYLPVLLLSGVLFSAPSGQAGWLTTLIRDLPAQPIVDAVTRALHGSAGGAPPIPGHDLAVLAAWTAVGLLASLRLFRWDPRPPARRRTTHQGAA